MRTEISGLGPWIKQHAAITLALLWIMLVAHGVAAQSQDTKLQGGRVGIGMRNSVNLLGGNKMFGIGAGGQWKLSFGPRVNTDFFVDLIDSKGEHNSFRKDYHIGWGVQFALPKSGFGSHRFVPYVIAGQCFDLTRVGVVTQTQSPLIFSVAIQGGTGVSSFVHRSVELNLQLQYMMHMTQHVHLQFDEAGLATYEVEKGATTEGHLLLTFSMTFYLLQLWGR
jgi:hypothetical protein